MCILILGVTTKQMQRTEGVGAIHKQNQDSYGTALDIQFGCTTLRIEGNMETPEIKLADWLRSLESPATYAAIAAQAQRLGADIHRSHIQWIWPADDRQWGWRTEESKSGMTADKPEHRRWGFVL